ncbi:hypothetical protein AVEN_81928-1 [Araneus ventricosus]|uniref:Uncharacterized protein n=1 Tax=Araneus ventricosus TaxID=182803 RepID=A0A4Y2GJR5_ARAVE|nr:hypothetical protein AVEN_81928-1 [Araneus ventricosus]
MTNIEYNSQRPHHFSMLTARYEDLKATVHQTSPHWTINDWKQVIWSDESRFNHQHDEEKERMAKMSQSIRFFVSRWISIHKWWCGSLIWASMDFIVSEDNT